MRKDHQTLELCDRFFDAIERKDVAGMEACLAPEAIIWHSRDNLYQSRADNVRGNRAFMANFEEVHYKDRRVHVFEGGFVQQHTFCLTNRSGFTGEMKVCFIAYVRDGMISRIYEYYDYGQVGKLTGQR